VAVVAEPTGSGGQLDGFKFRIDSRPDYTDSDCYSRDSCNYSGCFRSGSGCDPSPGSFCHCAVCTFGLSYGSGSHDNHDAIRGDRNDNAARRGLRCSESASVSGLHRAFIHCGSRSVFGVK
jgi:hypothetical protein